MNRSVPLAVLVLGLLSWGCGEAARPTGGNIGADSGARLDASLDARPLSDAEPNDVGAGEADGRPRPDAGGSPDADAAEEDATVREPPCTPGLAERIAGPVNPADSFLSVSADGRHAAFSTTRALVPDDTNAHTDVFVVDRWTSFLVRASVSVTGREGPSASTEPSLSPDGRYLAFSSQSDLLAEPPTGSGSEIYLKDLETAALVLISVDRAGRPARGPHGFPKVSESGRVVVFESRSASLVPGMTGSYYQIYARDVLLGTTELISVSTTGGEPNAGSGMAEVSADGRYVTFVSSASNLVSGPRRGAGEQVYLRDRLSGTTTLISGDPSGTAVGVANMPAISGDGRYVAFVSGSDALVAGDTNGFGDVFVRDTWSAALELVSTSSSGIASDAHSVWPNLDPSGRFVTFASSATTLAPMVRPPTDAFVRDRRTSSMVRATPYVTGAPFDAGDLHPKVTEGGRYVFLITQSRLAPTDTDDEIDVYAIHLCLDR